MQHSINAAAQHLLQVHALFKEQGGKLVDGYAPFCKHVFVPNFVGKEAAAAAGSSWELHSSRYVTKTWRREHGSWLCLLVLCTSWLTKLCRHLLRCPPRLDREVQQWSSRCGVFPTDPGDISSITPPELWQQVTAAAKACSVFAHSCRTEHRPAALSCSSLHDGTANPLLLGCRRQGGGPAHHPSEPPPAALRLHTPQA
jgi:hypothetical protein